MGEGGRISVCPKRQDSVLHCLKEIHMISKVKHKRIANIIKIDSGLDIDKIELRPKNIKVNKGEYCIMLIL